jgi:transcriptional regulator with XRE-family HTH domain
LINLNYQEIGLKIKQKRKALNLTQLQLAEKVGLTESSISRYESGKIATMPTSTVNKICKELYIEPAELLGITPEKAFEWDLKDILASVEELPSEYRNDIIDQFKSQIKLYWRLYYAKKN